MSRTGLILLAALLAAPAPAHADWQERDRSDRPVRERNQSDTLNPSAAGQRNAQDASQDSAAQAKTASTQSSQSSSNDKTGEQRASLCKLCRGSSRSSSDARPLRIEIVSGIDFSRMALAGHNDGSAELDPQTGAKHTGQGLIDLGGLSFQGQARVTGEPMRQVRIDLPAKVTLYSPSGDEAELTDFQSDSPAISMLDANGTLTFRFGARLTTKGGMGGNFRGRIPIRVDYN